MTPQRSYVMCKQKSAAGEVLKKATELAKDERRSNNTPKVPAHCETDSGSYQEPMISIGDAAGRLNIQPWKLRRAAKIGLVPSYKFFNSRRLVRLSEVVSAIQASRCGGGE